jgi:tRNA pseudouridine38-40 synthase
MHRYFLEISYIGTAYHGWQFQPNAVSIQEVINNALSMKLRSEINCTGSGRTDAGVHALMQVAHFDVENKINDLIDFQHQLNSMLPRDISINSIFPVHDIYKLNQNKDPFHHGRSYLFDHQLDLESMNAACQVILNWTDFQAFSRVRTDVNTFNCTISHATWEQNNDKLIFSVTANRFLRSMVRTLVGTMLDIAEKKISLDDFQAILKSKDRKKAGRSVPACGLYLSKIEFPETIKV